MYNPKLVVLRARKGVPGVGRKLSRHFNAYEVTCKSRPAVKVPDGAYVLNYGRSQLPVWYEKGNHKLINTPDAVYNCCHKDETLKLLQLEGVPCLQSTTSPWEAADWLHLGQKVIVRHTVTGKQGKGVELVSPGESLPFAPLYTKFYDKSHEFRVHVFDGKVIDLVQKKKMGAKKRAERGIDEVDLLTRNHKKGWVFAHNDLICDVEGRLFIEGIAVAAARAVGATYCGVDILAKYDGDTFLGAVVCEVNSAPGMSSPTTFKAYCKAIEEYIDG